MAGKHNFATMGPQAYYNREGKPEWCHSEDDVARAKQAGFTSASYVKSSWPTSVWNKKTGECRPVGRLEWDLEKNKAAVAALGDDWTTEHVPVPEPVAAKPIQNSGIDLIALTGIITENIAAKTRIDELEDVITAMADSNKAADERTARLEAMVKALSTPPHAPAPQDHPAPHPKSAQSTEKPEKKAS